MSSQTLEKSLVKALHIHWENYYVKEDITWPPGETKFLLEC